MGQFGHAQAPGDGQQEDIFVDLIEALDQLEQDKALGQINDRDQERQINQLQADIQPQIAAFAITLQ